MLTLGIESTRGLIKQNDLWLADECPRDGDSLLLTSRQTHASLTHFSVKALREQLLVLDKS